MIYSDPIQCCQAAEDSHVANLTAHHAGSIAVDTGTCESRFRLMPITGRAFGKGKAYQWLLGSWQRTRQSAAHAPYWQRWPCPCASGCPPTMGCTGNGDNAVNGVRPLTNDSSYSQPASNDTFGVNLLLQEGLRQVLLVCKVMCSPLVMFLCW